MKILILTNNIDEKSGWGRYSQGIIKELEKDKSFSLKILTANPEEDGYFFPKKINLFSFCKTIIRLRKEINEVDIVHSFDGYPFSIFAFLSGLGLKNKKYFINGVGTYSVLPFLNKYKSVFLKLAYKKANKIFCISNYTKSRILKHVPDLKNTEVVFMGHVIPEGNLYQVKKIDKNNLRIVSVGALKTRKGQLYSIQAIDLLKRDVPDIHLDIVGSLEDRKYVEKLKTIIQQKGLENNVSFLGMVDDEKLLDVYQKSDIFLMPSITQGENFEGFGLVYIEAAYFGLPSVGCWGTGAEDAILDGKTGKLIKQKSKEEIVRATKEILEDYDKMSKDSHEWSLGFTWEKTVNNYIKYYKQ